MAQHILIVEDEIKLATLLRDYLAQSGFETTMIHNGAEAEPWLESHQANLILLDLMLPGKDGVEICKDIRRHSQIPIVMITAKVEEIDRLLGLELGADDYLPKPFEPRELLARIESVLRRRNPDNGNTLRAGELSIDFAAEQVSLRDRILDLTNMEFRCLSYLATNRRRVMTRELLLAELRGLDWEFDNRSVDILISRLRRKLEDDPAAPRFIATVRGSGYRFIA